MFAPQLLTANSEPVQWLIRAKPQLMYLVDTPCSNLGQAPEGQGFLFVPSRYKSAPIPCSESEQGVPTWHSYSHALARETVRPPTLSGSGYTSSCIQRAVVPLTAEFLA